MNSVFLMDKVSGSGKRPVFRTAFNLASSTLKNVTTSEALVVEKYLLAQRVGYRDFKG